MTMLVACAIWLVGGCVCLALRGKHTHIIGPASVVLGCVVGFIGMPMALMGHEGATVHLPWQMPFGALFLSADALAAAFAIPLLIVCALAAVYGGRYLAHDARQARVGRSWFFFNMLTMSMFVVVLAHNALLFLIAWEIMALSSFFLVMFDHEKPEVRRAGFTYLIATHLGTFFLLVMFLMMGSIAGSFDFDAIARTVPAASGGALLFIFALIGFGTKAGIMPLHVWLPEAHPAAPSHVSAVMSGVMIKTGIYGLVRAATFLGVPQAWWGWTLVCVGVVTGIMGILFALAQHDLKRLLAYSSVENIGIICVGLGIGWLGAAHGNYLIAAIGFAGALVHVANHAIFKSLLFMSAGAVAHATGTRDIDRLGGVMKRMPKSGVAFLIGAIAVCGLPPFNGFVSEFLIYAGSFKAIALHLAGRSSSAGLIAIAGLALIGGLAVACFTKVFGIVFLGEPRSDSAREAHEAGPAMTGPMLVLAASCLGIGLAGPWMLRACMPAVGVLIGGDHAGDVASALPALSGLLMNITIAGAALLVLTAVFMAVRRALLSGRTVQQTVTWGCGYAAQSSRMQYTSSSFAQPLTNLFRFALGTHHKEPVLREPFPQEITFSTETPDVWRRRFYDPAFFGLAGFFRKFQWLQHGRINLYILCIVLALLVLLGWKLR